MFNYWLYCLFGSCDDQNYCHNIKYLHLSSRRCQKWLQWCPDSRRWEEWRVCHWGPCYLCCAGSDTVPWEGTRTGAWTSGDKKISIEWLDGTSNGRPKQKVMRADKYWRSRDWGHRVLTIVTPREDQGRMLPWWPVSWPCLNTRRCSSHHSLTLPRLS